MSPQTKMNQSARGPNRHRRARLRVESLETRELPANNITLVAGADVNIDIHNPGNNPTSLIRTTGANAQLSLATLEAELQKSTIQTVIVSTEAKNQPGNANQAGNIVWDATAAGSLDFTGFGSGKTLVFLTVDGTGAVGDITLTSVEFLNGGSDDQISLVFDTFAINGDVRFLSAGPGSESVVYSAEAIRDLTVDVGNGEFQFIDNGIDIGAADAGGTVSITAGDVSISHQGGLTAAGNLAINAAGAATFASGTGLLATGNMSITATGAVDFSNSGITAETGSLTLAGAIIGVNTMNVVAGANLIVSGATSVMLNSGTYDVPGNVAISGGVINMSGFTLPSIGNVGNVIINGTNVILNNASILSDGSMTVTGAAVTLNFATLQAFALSVNGPVNLLSTVDLRGDGSITIAGDINGAANLTLDLTGTVAVGGNIGALTPLASLRLLRGRLSLGTHNLASADVEIGLPFAPVEATLGMTGTLTGDVIVRASGNLAPGGQKSVGLMIVSGNVTFTDGDFAVDFGPGNTFDQLLVTGSVAISGASQLGGGLGVGNMTGPSATIIDSAGGVTGQFANAPIGAPVLVGADVVMVTTYSPNVIVVPVASSGSTVTGMDPDDTTKFKATLTGGGQLVTGKDASNRLFLVARNTTPFSKLTIVTTANGSDDVVTFGAGILVGGPLALFSAPKVNIGRQFRAGGAVTTATFRDFLNDAGNMGIDFGGTSAQATTIVARNLRGSVHTGSRLATLRVAQTLGAQVNDPFFEDSLVSTPAIGKVTALAATTNFNSAGPIATIAIVGNYFGDIMTASLGTLTTGSFTGDFQASGAVTSLKSVRDWNGAVEAASLGKFTAGGGAVDLQVTGAIGSIIGVGAAGLELELSASKVGPVTIAGGLRGDATPDGNDWSVVNGITSLKAASIADLDVSAKFIGAVSALGSSLYGLSGDIQRSTFTLSGNDGTLAQNGIKALTAKGNVFDSSFFALAGNVGPVVVGRFHNSKLHVNYVPPPSGDFTAGSFGPGNFKLASFRTTAVPTIDPNHPLHWAFKNSEIAAESITTVTLSGLETDNGNAAFGIKVQSAGAQVKVLAADPDFPANKLNTLLSPSPTPIADDFYFMRV